MERLRAGWETGLPTGVVTVCCSEIDDAARLWDPDPRPMAEALVRHDELIAAVVERGGGRVVRAQGESGATVSVFDSATQALEAAVAAQRALADEPWPAGLRLRIRWGIHTGEGIDPAAALGGRVRAQADAGQILLTQVAAELVAGRLPGDWSLVALGAHRLTPTGAPQPLFAVAAPGIDAPPEATACPYRGLLAFEPGDARFFFGREAVVDDLLGRIAPGHLVAVVGASGAGKSSVLRAGVVAAVEAGRVPGVERAIVVTPGADATLDVPDDPARLLVVDQLEELFTRCDDPERRSAFVAALLERRGPVAVGLRADLYGRLGAHPELAQAVAGDQVLLGAMTRAELERAVTAPAGLAGLKLEPGLTELIVRDVATEPGALPMLSHALRATWELRDGRTLTVDGYRAQRRRRLRDRAHRRRARRRAAGGAARARPRRVPAHDRAGRGRRRLPPPRPDRRARARGHGRRRGRRAARAPGRRAAGHARRRRRRGRARGAHPRVAAPARLAGGGPRRDPRAPPPGRRRGAVGGRRPRPVRPAARRAAGRRGRGRRGRARAAQRGGAGVRRRGRRAGRARAPRRAAGQPPPARAPRRRRRAPRGGDRRRRDQPRPARPGAGRRGRRRGAGAARRRGAARRARRRRPAGRAVAAAGRRGRRAPGAARDAVEPAHGAAAQPGRARVPRDRAGRHHGDGRRARRARAGHGRRRGGGADHGHADVDAGRRHDPAPGRGGHPVDGVRARRPARRDRRPTGRPLRGARARRGHTPDTAAVVARRAEAGRDHADAHDGLRARRPPARARRGHAVADGRHARRPADRDARRRRRARALAARAADAARSNGSRTSASRPTARSSPRRSRARRSCGTRGQGGSSGASGSAAASPSRGAGGWSPWRSTARSRPRATPRWRCSTSDGGEDGTRRGPDHGVAPRARVHRGRQAAGGGDRERHRRLGPRQRRDRRAVRAAGRRRPGDRAGRRRRRRRVGRRGRRGRLGRHRRTAARTPLRVGVEHLHVHQQPVRRHQPVGGPDGHHLG